MGELAEKAFEILKDAKGTDAWDVADRMIEATKTYEEIIERYPEAIAAMARMVMANNFGEGILPKTLEDIAKNTSSRTIACFLGACVGAYAVMAEDREGYRLGRTLEILVSIAATKFGTVDFDKAAGIVLKELVERRIPWITSQVLEDE